MGAYWLSVSPVLIPPGLVAAEFEEISWGFGPECETGVMLAFPLPPCWF